MRFIDLTPETGPHAVALLVPSRCTERGCAATGTTAVAFGDCLHAAEHRRIARTATRRRECPACARKRLEAEAATPVDTAPEEAPRDL